MTASNFLLSVYLASRIKQAIGNALAWWCVASKIAQQAGQPVGMGPAHMSTDGCQQPAVGHNFSAITYNVSLFIQA